MRSFILIALFALIALAAAQGGPQGGQQGGQGGSQNGQQGGQQKFLNSHGG